MQHSVRDEQGIIIVAFEGEVDLEHSPKAREVLLEAISRGKNTFVDLASVTYIDSSGVASLVEAYQATRNQSANFALISVNPAAMRVLQLARLDKVFTIYETLAEGIDGSP